jgi:hypothetical protein
MTAARTIGSEETDTAARDVNRTLCISARRAEMARAARGQAEPASVTGCTTTIAVRRVTKRAKSQLV